MFRDIYIKLFDISVTILRNSLGINVIVHIIIV